MPLTPDEERRVEELLARTAEEALRAGERASLRRMIAARARKLLRADYAAAAEVVRETGIGGAIRRLAEAFLPASLARWREGLAPVLEDVAEAVTEPKASPEVLGVSFDLANPRMREWFEGYVSELAETVSRTTHDQVVEVVREAQEQGLSVPETSERLRERAGIETKRRADLIARTELHRTSIGASLLQAQESGVVKTKTWRTARDARVRDAHERMEGETVGVFEIFSNGLPFPLEPNCRCYLKFGMDWEAFDARREAGVGTAPLGPDDPGGPNHRWFAEGTMAESKFEPFLLNPAHEQNRGKAAGFRDVLGIGPGDGELLRQEILAQLDRASIVERPPLGGPDGLRTWTLRIPDFRGPNGNVAPVLTAWALDPANTKPHFVTAYVNIR